jgi:hypothetical protein
VAGVGHQIPVRRKVIAGQRLPSGSTLCAVSARTGISAASCRRARRRNGRDEPALRRLMRSSDGIHRMAEAIDAAPGAQCCQRRGGVGETVKAA